MLNVSGVTFCHTTNYGTSLQAYALQRAIEGMTVGGEKCKYQLISLFDCEDYPKCKVRLRTVPLTIYQKLCRARFRTFEDRNMHFYRTKRLADLPDLNRTQDAFVCGSDVIWNPQFNHELGAYYLDFASKYKFSYAVSFGTANVPDEKLEKIGGYIAQLDRIGLREAAGAEIVRRVTDAPTQVVCDPVLLLDHETWNDVAGPTVEIDPYIFVYTTHLTKTFDKFVRRLGEETGLRIEFAVWEPQSVRRAIKRKMLFVPKQPEWLRKIRDAEYVVTNSFHATVFAVLFRKKFFTVVGGKKNERENVRMYEFLKNIGMEDRILDEVPETIDRGEPDHVAAAPRLQALVDSSRLYLRENLEEAYRRKTEAASTERA